jgi:hypothetical protein
VIVKRYLPCEFQTLLSAAAELCRLVASRHSDGTPTPWPAMR